MAAPMRQLSKCSSKKSYTCPYKDCESVFSNRYKLRVHIRVHTGERPYCCDIGDCKRSYTNPAHLKRHKQSAHRENEDIHSQLVRCPFEDCVIGLIGPANLRKHIQRRHEGNHFKCSFAGCQETFKKHHQLTHHTNLHTSKTPCKCTHEGCDKSFSVESKLKRHQKQHEGYSCSIEGCGEKFSKWTLLRKHTTSSHKKEFVCSECKKTFSQKSWLKCHQKVHSEVRDVFVCPKENCGRMYLEQRNLTAHIKSYHEGKRFKCEEDMCDRSFTSRKNLMQHLKMHDPNLPLKKKKVKKRKRKVTLKLCGIDTRTVTEDAVGMSCESEDNIPSYVFLDRSQAETKTRSESIEESARADSDSDEFCEENDMSVCEDSKCADSESQERSFPSDKGSSVLPLSKIYPEEQIDNQCIETEDCLADKCPWSDKNIEESIFNLVTQSIEKEDFLNIEKIN